MQFEGEARDRLCKEQRDAFLQAKTRKKNSVQNGCQTWTESHWCHFLFSKNENENENQKQPPGIEPKAISLNRFWSTTAPFTPQKTPSGFLAECVNVSNDVLLP
jgi:hypothetical protein